MLNWYLQSGKESDVVVSTRVRFARNIKEFPFTTKYKKEDAINIINELKNVIPDVGYGLKILKLKDMDDTTTLSLIEKHIISPDFALSRKETGAIALNEEENICIMINEEDHLRIQIFSAGFEIENLLNLGIEIDEKIGKKINYAFNENYGFLTACPTNVGTGMRISVMVHLPALTKTGNINKILDVVNGFNMNIRGIYGEGSNSQGNMYQISNKQTLGISEQETIKNLKLIIEKIIEQERLARNYLMKNSLELEDKIYRSFGILDNCKKISSKECKELLSDVKLGTDLGILNKLTDLKVNKIEIYTKPANLQKYVGKQLNSYERDIKRAEIIKSIINE